MQSANQKIHNPKQLVNQPDYNDADQLSMVVLGSGSRGNAYYIWNRDTAVLIDCGLSTKQILARLEKVGVLHPQIDAVFITHEHTDHVSSCAILEKRLNRLGKRQPFT